MRDTIRHAIQIRNNKQNELKMDRQNTALLEEYKTEKKRVTTYVLLLETLNPHTITNNLILTMEILLKFGNY